MSYLKTATVLAMLLLSAFASISAAAKEQEVQGYYIPRASGKKISTTFYFTGKRPSLISMQQSIDYADNRGKKQMLLPTDADEFGFIYEKDTIVMRSVYDNLNSQTDLFPRVLVDGVVSCYSYYEYTLNAPGPGGTPMGQSATPSTLLQHSSGELVSIRFSHQRKDLAKFFADCPALAEKIEKDVHRKMTIVKCAQEYNKNCP